MPASAYYIVAECDFPEQDAFTAAETQSLQMEGRENVEDVSSAVERSEEEEIEGCTIYNATHEYRKQLRFLGRARGREFREYVQIHNFAFFRYHEAPAGLGFHPIVLRSRKSVVFDFLDRMNVHRSDFDLAPIEIDLDCLRQKPRVQELRGAWFSKMRSPNMSATAVYGPHVEQANEFQNAEAHGELSNLTLPFDYAGDSHTIQVTKAGAVVLYETFALDAQALGLVMQVAQEIITGCFDVT